VYRDHVPGCLPPFLKGFAPVRRLGGAGMRITLLLLIAMVGAGLWTAPAAAQPDSVRTRILVERGLPEDHSPRKALWRAFALPGWGQLYNDQYYKMPIVYAGLAGLTYSILRNHDRYKLYQRAHLFKISEERVASGQLSSNPYLQYRTQYRLVQQSISTLNAEIPSRTLRSQRDRYRRWRDLSVVGTGLFYVLTVVDAYVSAHLLTFDVGDELSLKVVPSPMGNSAAIRLQF
jgi:hypothetical protein